jgi:hypothetical protein
MQRAAIRLDGTHNNNKSTLGSKNQFNGLCQQRQWFHSNASHGSCRRQLPLVSIDNGHTRRCVHSHTQQQQQQHQQQQQQQQQQQHEQFVARVTPTNSQKRRNGKIAAYGKEKEWQKILDTFHCERNDFGLQNLAVTLSQLAKISAFPRNHPKLREILKMTANCIDESVIDTRCYSNICHSIGKLQQQTRDKDASAQRIINHLGSLKFAKDFWDSGNAQDMANVAWSLARLHRPDLMKTLLSVMDDKCRNSLFTGATLQALANVIWACADLGQAEPVLFATVEERSHWLVTEGDPLNISTIAWAFAKLNHQSPALFAEIDQRSDWYLANGSPRDISMTAWACGTLQHKTPALFTAIDKQSEWLVSSGTAQDVANTAWAFATLSHKSNSLFSAIEKRSDWFVANANLQEIAMTSWAFAKRDYKSPALFGEIEKRSDWIVTTGMPQSIANIVWAYATLSYRSAALFTACEQRTDSIVDCGNPQSIAMTAWAFATLGHRSSALFDAIENRSDWLVSSGDRQAIIITVCACATLGYTAPALFAAIAGHWDGLMGNANKEDLSSARWAFETLGHHVPATMERKRRGKNQKGSKTKQGHGRKPGADETVAGKPVHAPPNGVGLSGS